MKKILLILLTSLLLFNCNDDDYIKPQKTDLENSGLIGKIKTLKVTEFDATEVLGVITKDHINSTTITTYNIQGNIETEEHYNKDDVCLYKIIYTNDSLGKHVKLILYEDNHPPHELTYKYDSKGYLIEIISSDTQYFRTYINDDKGNIIEEIEYEDDDLRVQHTYKYNCNEKMTEKSSYYFHTNSEVKWLFNYDLQGYLVEVKEKNIYGTRRVTYKNDKHGNKIEEVHHTHDPDFDDPIYTFKYQYDNNGNWTQFLEYRGDFSLITEREIEYY